MNELQVTSGGRSYTFQPGQTVLIGRSPDNSIVVGDLTVSRRHAQLTWGPDGWRFQNVGQARAFQQGHEVGPLIVREPVELSLASPQGPVLRLRPLEATGSPPTRAASPQADPLGPPPPPPPSPAPPSASARPGARPARGTEPAGAGPRAGHHAGNHVGHHAAVADEVVGVADEVVLAFEILVPVKAWLRDSGWRQGLRLLVIAYALLPLVFIALFSSSSSLAVPGFAYSLYVAPLWVIAFWLLVRPGPIAALEVYVGTGIVIWVTLWLYTVTVTINDQLVHAVRNGNFLAALAVGYNEEITKALPILLAALILLKFRGTKLSVRMWMFLGTISGLTFGILEERLYTEIAIAQVASANAVSVADAGVLDFAFRVFVDGFEHAVWAGRVRILRRDRDKLPAAPLAAHPARGLHRGGAARAQRLELVHI